MTEVAFYCVSSELYFPATVGLVNSLRMNGHNEPVYVLDRGMSAAHRRLISSEATLVEGEPEVPPYLSKTIAPLLHPAEVMVVIDVDMVAVRSLAPLIAQAADGRVLAVKDGLDRFVPEWGELLDLGRAEHRPYVSSGLVVLGGAVGREALELWDDRRRRVSYERSYFERDDAGYAFRYIDQDVLNAILCTRVSPDQVTVLPPEAAPVPPFRGLRLTGATPLRCVNGDDSEPYVVHQFVRKPWVEPMYHSPYSELLARAWRSPDAPVRLPEDEIPLRMRTGLLARIERRRVDAYDLVRWYARDVIPEWIEARRRTGSGVPR